MFGGLEGLRTIFDTISRGNFNKWIGSLVPLRQTWKNANVKRKNEGHLVDIGRIRGRTLAFMFASIILDSIRKIHGTEPNFQNKFKKNPSPQWMTDMVIPFHFKLCAAKMSRGGHICIPNNNITFTLNWTQIQLGTIVMVTAFACSLCGWRGGGTWSAACQQTMCGMNRMEQTRVAQQAFRGKSDGNKFFHIRFLLCGIDLLPLYIVTKKITTDF